MLRRVRARARSSRVEWLLSLLLVVAVAAEHLYMSGAGHPQWSGWSAIIGVLAVALALLIRPRYPAAAIAVVCALVGGTVVVNDGWSLASYVVFAAIMSFMVGRRAERIWPSAAVACAAVAVLTVLDAVLNSEFVAGDQVANRLHLAMAGNMVIFMALPWLSGRYLRQIGLSHSTKIEQAQLTERARIAQEMHDSLGHELSLIALRAGALEVAPGLDATHQRSAGAIRAAAAEATERLGEIVGVLRPAAEGAPLAPASAGIGDLVERARESGMDVRLEDGATDGDEPALGPVRHAAAHRIVQESLTNAARHAPGSSVTVSVEREVSGVRIAVANTRATLPPRAGSTTGLGLAGLEEAARAAGGTLRHGPIAAGGFEVVAELPAHDDVRHGASL